MARSNGGIIGKVNKASFGKDTTTVKTSTGSVTLQSGTRKIRAAIVAGGGAGGTGLDAETAGVAGGSGIVILRAPGPLGPTFSVAPGTNTKTTLPGPAGGCTVMSFTVTGTLTIS